MIKIQDTDKLFASGLLSTDNAKIDAYMGQIRVIHECGCIIATDNKGEWLLPCNEHSIHFNKMSQNEKIK